MARKGNVIFVLLAHLTLMAGIGAQAQNINIQFGSGSAGFTEFTGTAAAPGQGGFFNEEGANPTSTALKSDRGGTTAAFLTISGLNADVFTSTVISRFSSDDTHDVTRLLQSSRRSTGASSFTILFSGIQAGAYDVYIFGAGSDADAGSTFTVNDGAVPQTTEYTGHEGSITAGLDYDVFPGVIVENGLLTIQGSTNGNTQYAFLNGIQLHALTMAPEPPPSIIFCLGLLGLCLTAWRGRTRLLLSRAPAHGNYGTNA